MAVLFPVQPGQLGPVGRVPCPGAKLVQTPQLVRGVLPVQGAFQQGLRDGVIL